MQAFYVTVHILLPSDITDETIAEDAISVALSDTLRSTGAILDWCYADPETPRRIRVPTNCSQGEFQAALENLKETE